MKEKQYIKEESGSKLYYKDPEMTILHRTDGPAIEFINGQKEWYVNDTLHRLDGPAIEYADGIRMWFIDDSFIFEVNKSGKIIDRMQ